MSKKKTTIIGGIIVILFIVLVGNKNFRQSLLYFVISILPKTECQPPDRPVDVPLEAKWCGGCDGGYWIYLVPDEYESHFVVYSDWSGDVYMDGIFVPIDKDLTFNSDNWKEEVWSYRSSSEDSSVYICIKDSIQARELICKYPAFGGNEWEIIKEKYNIPLTTTEIEYEPIQSIN